MGYNFSKLNLLVLLTFFNKFNIENLMKKLIAVKLCNILLQKQVKNILKEIVMGEFNIKIVNYRK
jgi:hypothetical protein